MQHLKRITILLGLVTLLCACAKEQQPEVQAHTAIGQYAQAAAQLEAADCISMNISIDRTVSFGADTYTQSEEKQTVLSNAGTDRMLAQTTGTTQYGQHQIVTEEYYCDGQLYLSVNSNLLCGEYSKEDLLASVPPIKMIDPSAYRQITAQRSADSLKISFEDPTQAELWALPEGAGMLSASATVELTQEGHLSYTRYDLTFCHNDIIESFVIHVQCAPLENYTIPAPDTKAYTRVENILAPLSLEKAYGMLLQTTQVDGKLTRHIYSEASSIYYDSSTSVQRQGDSAQIETTVTLEDPSRGGDVTTKTQQEQYENGSYSIWADGAEPDQQTMEPSQFFSYCTQLLSQNILSSGYVIQCTMEDLGETILLTFHANDTLAQKLCESTCSTIYQDPAFLDHRASSYENYSVIYRITVDAVTGLPLTCDMDYSGSHTIEQIDYILETRYRQTYTYSD